MLGPDVLFLSVRDLGELIRARKLSPVEYTKALLTRIERFDPAYNSFIKVMPDEALKAAKAAELFGAVDSVDSVKLAEKLDAAARSLDKKLAVLIEINVAGETAKSGVVPDSRELEELLLAAPRFEALEFHGLMTVPPFSDDPEGARPYFRLFRGLRNAIAARRLSAINMDVLSMGMSHDFDIAIEEGSTCVRVGTAIFGERPRP